MNLDPRFKVRSNASLAERISSPAETRKGPATPDTIRQRAEEFDALLQTPVGLEVDPEVIAEIEERKAKANAEYDQTKSNNEWAEVAQLIGKALTQMGAAQQGMKTGVDMSNLKQEGNIDYAARTESARKGRDAALDSLRTERRDLEADRKHSEGSLRDDLANRMRAAGAKLDNEKFLYGEQQSNIRTNNTYRGQEARELNQIADDAGKREQILDKRINAQQKLREFLNTLSDLKSNQVKKELTKLPELLAASGLDQGEYREMYENALKDAGYFGKDAKARRKLSEALADNKTILETAQERDQYRKTRETAEARRNELMGLPATRSQEVTSKEPPRSPGAFDADMSKPDISPTKPRDGYVRMMAPDGSTRDVPKNQVEALKKKGAVELK